MDLSKLTTADKVIAASGILLFIASFLEWFKYSIPSTTVQGITVGGGNVYSESGWDRFFTGGLPALIALALVGYVVVTRFLDGVELPDAPWPIIILSAGGLAAILVVLRLLIGADKSGVDLDRSYGLFIAAVAAIGLGVGSFLKFQEEGGQLPTKKDGTGTPGTGTPGDGGSATPF
jgi:hypothetical protein